MPEVLPYLETPYAHDALRVLGRIGPAAAVAADRPADFPPARRGLVGRWLGPRGARTG
ncbi:hypothetical protein [Streptomyces sp. NPDC056387]|uniref:hypothetical protein n=1 Tax=Streptomyces sp. NPDC056387 TaxID=3345803 RepID=UPI0035D74FD3